MTKEFAWAVGLFEGEGSIHVSVRKGGWIDRKLSLTSVDEDVIRRFRLAVGVGTVTGPYTDRRGNRQPVWRWDCSRWNDIERVLRQMLPQLCSRRRKKAEEMLALPPSRRTPKSRPVVPRAQALRPERGMR
jgi:hypothetical protein